MHPSIEAQMLQYVQTHQPRALATALMLLLLTAFSSLRFGEALVTIRSDRRRGWIIAAACVSGYCRFSVQLCLLPFLGAPANAVYHVPLLLLGLCLAVCGRLSTFASVTRDTVRLRTIAPSSMIEAAAVVATQLTLIRAAQFWYPLSAVPFLLTLGLCWLVCLSAQVTVAALLRQSHAPWHSTRILYPVAGIIGAIGVRYMAMLVTNSSEAHVTFLQAHPLSLQVAHVVPFTVMSAVGLLCVSHFALFLHWRGIRWHRRHNEIERQKEVANALAEQRAMRLQNQALIDEIRERKKAESKLAQAVFADTVTGLHNRAYLNDRLRLLFQKKANRLTSTRALLYIDLDNFKSVNDMLGHAQGDRALMEIAKRLKAYISEDDVLVRFGGDEFAVLLHCESDCACAMRLAQHLLTIVERPVELAGNTFHLTASIGLCTITPSYTEADHVIRDADIAMYRAKRDGGARVTVFLPAMYTEMLQAIYDRAELKRAIEQQEFVLWYQPLVDMGDGSIHGVEALIRWQHPVKGLVGPFGFIHLAEETGHIVEIGNWVLQTACADFHTLQSRSATPLLLSVNVSTRQLELPNFVDLLKRTLTEAAMPANQLQLEITESILMEEPVRMGALIQEIRSLGVKIAFDDFGTGYSSLSYIQRFPIDTLKIDQSFVRSLTEHSVNVKIIRLMLDLSRAVGMAVSVEGVETEPEAAALLKLGCRIAQGYLYSKPVDMESFLQLLARGNVAPRAPFRIPAA